MLPLEAPVRAMVLWFPDWPIIAARLAEDLPTGIPAAVLDQGVVSACSAEARADGVVRGLKLREAQTRCPGLVLCAADPGREEREFEPVLASIEDLLPGIEILRPGLCVVRARGAARYYGSEEAAANAVLESARRLGVEARAGFADSIFAAEQAARATMGTASVLVLPPGFSADFLSPLPVEVLGQTKLTSLLKRLGILTLGDFVKLPVADVRARFGAAGATAHAYAAGLDPRRVIPRVPPRKLDQLAEFEPGLDRVDRIAFAIRSAAGDFVAALRSEGLVCTELRVLVTDENGKRSERSWGHPRHFTAGDVVDRVRWQLQEDRNGTSSEIASPVARVQLFPQRVDSIAHHGQALFGDGADERVHHGLSRIQSMLGHEAVLVPAVAGGRLLAERRLLIPWGDALPAGTSALAARPWPGRIPDPQPATVFSSPRQVQLLDAKGETVCTDPRGALLNQPAWFCLEEEQGRRRVAAGWAGPWPLRQRWWDAMRNRRAERFQLLDDSGDAWLLLLEDGRSWWAEARYD